MSLCLTSLQRAPGLTISGGEKQLQQENVIELLNGTTGERGWEGKENDNNYALKRAN